MTHDLGSPTSTDEDAAAEKLRATLPFWTLIPVIEDVDDRQAWVGAATPLLLADREIADAYAEQIALMLDEAIAEPELAPDACRLLFLVHPALGAVIWELVALPVGEAGSDRDLVWADVEAPDGSQTDSFTWNGLAGLQCVRLEPLTADDLPPAATARITLTREVAGRRTTLLAQAGSTELDALAMSTTPMQYLLATELVEELGDDLGGNST